MNSETGWNRRRMCMCPEGASASSPVFQGRVLVGCNTGFSLFLSPEGTTEKRVTVSRVAFFGSRAKSFRDSRDHRRPLIITPMPHTPCKSRLIPFATEEPAKLWPSRHELWFKTVALRERNIKVFEEGSGEELFSKSFSPDSPFRTS